jgi:hypothetical protein
MVQPEGPLSDLKMNEGAIRLPVGHVAAVAGALSAMGLGHVLSSMGYHLSRNWGVVLIVAGYAIPFAVARELAARRPPSVVESMDKER